MKKLLLFALLICPLLSWAGGGTCPSGANHIDPTNPTNGGGQGSVTLASLGVTQCYYVSSSGLDSNSGTTEGSPWLHLPTMSTFTGSYTAAVGDGIIVEGGSIWHKSSGSPSTGSWSISSSGNSSHPIYYGVDPTWFSGGSFARPVFNQDNALSTSTVGSCSFADDGTTFLSVSGGYIILDGFEWTGNCMSGSGDSSIVNPISGNNVIIERQYVHGWSMTSGVGDDGGTKFGNQSNSTSNTTNRYLFNVIDGADSTFGTSCNTPSCVSSGTATGWAFGDGWDVEYNVIRHVSNGVQAGQIAYLIGNFFEYLFEPTISGRHGNVVEMNFGNNCVNGVDYNNVTGNVDEGINWIQNCSNFYIFNNVWFNDQHFAPDPNGFLFCGPNTGGQTTAVVTVQFYNNTAQDIKIAACGASSDGAGWAAGSGITFENNHVMDFTAVSSGGFFGCNGGSCPITDNGGEVYQTTSVANGQGYTYANHWAPTSGTNATVGHANNVTSAFCSTLPNALAIAACEAGTSGAVKETSNWGGLFASYPAIAVNSRPASGAWDAGAYEFAATTTLTVTLIGNNIGSSVTSSPAGINCPTTCSASFNSGTVVTLTENPASPYFAYGFSAPTCPATTNLGAPCTFTITAATAVTATFNHISLPTTWVQNTEYIGKTSNVINFPTFWMCGATRYPASGNYASTQAGLQAAIQDAETCRKNTNAGTQINIPPGLYSGTFGLFLPQTTGDNSTNFIVLASSTPLPLGQTVCSHGTQDNVAASSHPGIRNQDCNATNMSYQLGTAITSVSGAFTLANGANANTSQYNDLAALWTIENTGTNHNALTVCATFSAGTCTSGWDSNNVGPHHYVILNAELRPQAGLASTAAPLSIGQGSETLQSQLPSHIHIAYSYLHGDWTDAPMTGCPSACVATNGPTGSNSLPNFIVLAGCFQCSIAYNYMDRGIRPGAEGHGIAIQLAQQIKIVHNWIEGQSIGVLCGGQSSQIAFTGFVGCTDVEDRANRYTYPYSWMLAYNAGVINQATQGTGTATNYVIGDVLNVIQGGASGGTITVATVTSGAPQTYTVTTQGTGYAVANNLVTSCVSCASGGSGATVNIVNGYEPNNALNGGDSYTRKNSHELKVGERYLMDGNIFENVDNSGAQNGTTISFKTDNNSSVNPVSNYWVIDENTTITNNLLRNSCNGPSLGYRSNSAGGDGGGIAFPTQLQTYANNLLYGYDVNNVPGCQGVSPQYGFRVAVTGNAAIWPSGQVSAHRDSTGSFVTLTLTSSLNPDLSISDTNVGDPVNVSGCTTDTTMNTGQQNLGPPALAGTLVNGLTIVYASTGPANTTDTTCTFNTGQGWPNFLFFNHNSDFATNSSFANDPESATNSGTNALAFSRNVTFANSLIIGGGLDSSRGEGTRTATQAYDATTIIYNNTVMAGRDASVVCPGHAAGAGGMAACYTEYSNTHAAVAPPVTLYGTPSANCTGSDPTVGPCVGVLGAMSTGTFPQILPDWHSYRLCHATDAGCSNTASLYAAGQADQASDGTDLGVSMAAIDAAQNLTLYVCGTPCGGGPFIDTLQIVPAPFIPGLLSALPVSKSAVEGNEP